MINNQPCVGVATRLLRARHSQPPAVPAPAPGAQGQSHQGPLLLHALLDGPGQVGVGELSAWRHGDLTAIRSLWLKTSPQ